MHFATTPSNTRRTIGDVCRAFDDLRGRSALCLIGYSVGTKKTHPESGLRILDSLVLDPDLDYNVAITLRNTDVGLLEKVNAVLDDLKSDGHPNPTVR
jgi:hypothetical protein